MTVGQQIRDENGLDNAKLKLKYTLMTNKNTAHNTRLAQWWLTSFIESLCFYCKFVLTAKFSFPKSPAAPSVVTL